MVKQQIKNRLAILDKRHHIVFKRMYSSTDIEKDINEVVDNIPIEKLDWANFQVSQTIRKLNQK